MRKQITVIVVALIVIVIGVVVLLMSYPRLDGKTYFLKKYEKTDNIAIETGYYGDLITFKDGKMMMIEIEEGEELLLQDKVVSSSGNAQILGDELIIIPPKAIRTEYENPKFDRQNHCITAEGLKEPIKVINSKEIEYKGHRFYIVNDKTKVEYLK